MIETHQASQPKTAQPPRALHSEEMTPTCCHQEMQILLRRAVLYSDGRVDFQTAWGCSKCGRRIL